MSLWKNLRSSADESPRPSEKPAQPAPSPAAQPQPIATERRAPAERRPVLEQGSSPMANLGKSLTIKGDVIGDEDTVIEGRVEGRVDLKNHHLTVGPNGFVAGEIGAKRVTIIGRVTGNVAALERVEITETGRLEGDVVSPKLLLQEGAQLNGSVAMRAPQAQPAAAAPQKKAEPAPLRGPAAGPQPTQQL